jgi:hypothetical protein
MPKIVEGPKAKLMKETIPALRAKAKALNVSDYTKRTKENLVQSIMLAQARKKRGMGGAKPGRPVTRTTVDKKKTWKKEYGPDGTLVDITMPNLKRDNVSTDKFTRAMVKPSRRDYARPALLPGKRRSKNGNIYYEYRQNRADNSYYLQGPGDWENIGQDELGKYEDLIFATTYKWSIMEDVENIELGENNNAIRIPALTPYGRLTFGALEDLMKIDAFWGVEAIGKNKIYLFFDAHKILK